MKCDDCQNFFSPYLDGEITAEERVGVEAHLRSCSHCNGEWHAFRAAVTALRQIPVAKVPPGFLAGIHDKLENPSLTIRIQEWLAGVGKRQVAIPTAFAMLVVGFVSASLIHFIPLNRQQETPHPQTANTARTAISQPAAQPASLLASVMPAKDHPDFYPGVPTLSEYEEAGVDSLSRFAMLPEQQKKQAPIAVDFVSTGGHNHSYLDIPLPSLSRYHQKTTIHPDLLITIHSDDESARMGLLRQIMQSPHWQADIYNQNTIILSVPAGSFDQLRTICCQNTASFNPAYARDSRYISPKRFLTVAVTLE
ncbi:MAG: anti-sigma factor family protein [Thermodesulfobacteriota bacterium]